MQTSKTYLTKKPRLIQDKKTIKIHNMIARCDKLGLCLDIKGNNTFKMSRDLEKTFGVGPWIIYHTN